MGELTYQADLIGLRLHLREPLHRGEGVRPATLDICELLPADPVQAALAMELDAAQLADVLWEALPGGTIDALLAELMGRRASVLRVGLLSADEIARLQRERTAEVSGSPGEAATGAVGGADTPVGAEGNGEPVGPWVSRSGPTGGRCNFWRGNAQCRYPLYHEVDEYPHAP